MELPDNQWNVFYKEAIENRKDISWIRKEMDQHNKIMEDCLSRVGDLEVGQGVQKTKLAFLIGSITAVLTIITNAGIWLYSHAGGIK